MGPSVAFDGTRYLVVWYDYRNGSDSDIYGTFVDTSGIVSDTLGFPICTQDSFQNHPSVGFDGTNYLVAWNDDRAEPVG